MVPGGWSAYRPMYKLKVEPDTEDALDVELSFELLFQHTETYPESEPLLKVSNPRGMTDSETDRLAAALQEAAAENVGMASIFAVMQAGKDWLESKAGVEDGALRIHAAALLQHAHTCCCTAPRRVQLG